MGFFSWVILIAGLLWLLQILGTWYQMRHYQHVLSGIAGENNKGYVGVGNARGRLGKGVILILVTGEDGLVSRALRMRGRTVFARFKDAPLLVGLDVEDLRDEEREDPYEAATMLSARRAVEQIDQIKDKQEVSAGVS